MRITGAGAGAGYNVTIAVDSQTIRRLNNLLDNSDPRILAELEATAAEATAAIQAHVQKRTPVNIGTLRNSIASEVTTVSSTPAHVVGHVFTNLMYAVPVELGSRPHMPPQGPIQYWVARKLHKSGTELTRVTNAIRWKIYRHGTKGKHMFERGSTAAIPFVNRRVEQAIKRITALLGGS